MVKGETGSSEVSKIRALTKVAKAQIEFSWKIEHFSFCSKKQEILGECSTCSLREQRTVTVAGHSN